MAKPTSPRWSNAAAASLSSCVIRAAIPPVSWLALIGICMLCPLPSDEASPSIAARNLPPLRHCETGSASPVISACRQHPGKKAVWKIAMAGYGASCPPTLTLRCCRKRRSRPSPIDLTAHPVNAWAIALRMRFWESRSPFSRLDKFCRPGWGSPHPGRNATQHLGCRASNRNRRANR